MNPQELRDARIRLGMTQREMAAYLGTTFNTVSRWETGAMQIAYPKMVRTMIDLKLRETGEVPVSESPRR